jgi:hypothetical protein
MTLFSEAAANIIENLACREAARHGGRVAPAQLLPHLPISLGLVKAVLDATAEDDNITRHFDDGIVSYTWGTSGDHTSAASQPESASACVACDAATPADTSLCCACTGLLQRELAGLANRTGWPAQAIIEHEIIYRAAEGGATQWAPESLAGRTRFTVRNLRGRLKALATQHIIAETTTATTPNYRFPANHYERDAYERNMQAIRRYPSARLQDMEQRLVRVLAALAAGVLGVLVLALCRIPLPLLVPLFLIYATVAAVKLWRQRSVD